MRTSTVIKSRIINNAEFGGLLSFEFFVIQLFMLKATKKIALWAHYPNSLLFGSCSIPSLRDRSRVVPRSDRACVFTERSVVKMQALRNRVESLGLCELSPCWVANERLRTAGGQPKALAVA